MSSYLSHKRKGFQGTTPAAFDGFGNRSRSFDGVDDTINLGQTADNAIFSVSSWFKLNTVNSNGSGIIGKWHNNTSASWLLYVRSASTSGNMTFIVRNGADNGHFILDSGVSASSLTGEWTHIVGVADGNNLTMYINGVSVASISYDGTINNPASDAHIGSYNADVDNTHRTNANIADVRIYDTDLTATDISDIYNGTNITTNLVGHWLTDADNVLDNAGTNHGTNYGSKYSYDNPSPPVEFGSASRLFNGTSNYVDLGNDTSLANIFAGGGSISIWIKPDTGGGGGFGRIFDKRLTTPLSKGWFLLNSNFSGSTYDIRFNVDCASDSRYRIITTNSISSATWQHVCITYNSDLTTNTAEIYINGTPVTYTVESTPVGAIIDDSSVDLLLGETSGTTSRSFDGKMADARIYDAELTASQVSDIYNGTDVQTNLIGHWLTDNDDVEDKAGTNDGTNYGSTYDYDAPFTEVTLPNHYWDLSDTGTYADSGKLASAGWDLNEYSSVNSSVQNIGTSTKTVLDTISGGVLEYKNGTNVDVGWDSESKEISMACWFYCTAIDNVGNWLISWRGGTNDNRIAQIFIRNDSGLQVFRGSIFDGQGNIISTPQSGTSISLNTWHHGALTWDNTTLKTYINGELFATGTNASVDGFGTNPVDCEFAIGRGAWDKTNSGTDHTGYTFGAGVWDVALTESQIKALYNDGNALDYSETTWR